MSKQQNQVSNTYGPEWAELYASLELREIQGFPLPKPTDSSLDQYEAKSNFRLPKSYRDFIKVFGPGMLGDDFTVRAPGYFKPTTTERSQAFNWWTDLEYFNQSIRKSELIADDGVAKALFQDIERIRSCVFFADNTGGEIIGWDPGDLRNGSSYEYGIYILIRHVKQPTLLAVDFSSFITDVCFGTRYGQIVDPGGEDGEYLPPKNFRPKGGFDE